MQRSLMAIAAFAALVLGSGAANAGGFNPGECRKVHGGNGCHATGALYFELDQRFRVIQVRSDGMKRFKRELFGVARGGGSDNH